MNFFKKSKSFLTRNYLYGFNRLPSLLFFRNLSISLFVPFIFGILMYSIAPNSSFVIVLMVAVSVIGFLIFLESLIARLHDQNKSSWNLLFIFIPFVNLLWFVIISFKGGTNGLNNYGEMVSVEYKAVDYVVASLFLVVPIYYISNFFSLLV